MKMKPIDIPFLLTRAFYSITVISCVTKARESGIQIMTASINVAVVTFRTKISTWNKERKLKGNFRLIIWVSLEFCFSRRQANTFHNWSIMINQVQLFEGKFTIWNKLTYYRKNNKNSVEKTASKGARLVKRDTPKISMHIDNLLIVSYWRDPWFME